MDRAPLADLLSVLCCAALVYGVFEPAPRNSSGRLSRFFHLAKLLERAPGILQRRQRTLQRQDVFLDLRSRRRRHGVGASGRGGWASGKAPMHTEAPHRPQRLSRTDVPGFRAAGPAAPEPITSANRIVFWLMNIALQPRGGPRGGSLHSRYTLFSCCQRTICQPARFGAIAMATALAGCEPRHHGSKQY